MKWSDLLQILRVRAVEETEGQDHVWPAETRRAALRDAARSAGRDDAAFLAKRAACLEAESRTSKPPFQSVLPGAPEWLIWGGWLAAFIIGWWLAALGQEREINLLALPLIAILAWNAAVMLLSLFQGLGNTDSQEPPSWIDGLTRRFAPPLPATSSEKESQQAADRFRELARPAAQRRLSFRFRAWLHIGAALLAFGGAAGMYARGWSREYRAVWESTLLNEHGARVFFHALFAPASRVSGVSIPLDALPAMRRGADAPAKQPGAALPWIHLYAATLGLFVVFPRSLLAWLELTRAGSSVARSLRSPDWRDYIANLRASVEGDGAPARVLAHGLAMDDTARARWRQLACTKWRDVGPIECQTIPVGGEVEFARAWKPGAARLMLVFNLSATPEAEVHLALVESLTLKHQQVKSAAPMLLALDDSELKKRWAGFGDAEHRLSERRDLWRRSMEGQPVAWI